MCLAPIHTLCHWNERNAKTQRAKSEREKCRSTWHSFDILFIGLAFRFAVLLRILDKCDCVCVCVYTVHVALIETEKRRAKTHRSIEEKFMLRCKLLLCFYRSCQSFEWYKFNSMKSTCIN